MLSWPGKRPITVVTACVATDGTPDLALNIVEVTHDEPRTASTTTWWSIGSLKPATRSPFLHFDEIDAPHFLIPAVRQYLCTP